MIKEASMMANKLMIMHSAKLIAKMKSGDEKENKISELEQKAKKLGFSRAEYEKILDKQNAYESVVRGEADVMNAYVSGISNHKSLFHEQPGVRKVDFVDGITPEIAEEKCEECGKDSCECEVEEGVAQYLAKKGQFEVKYAASKKGPIKVTKFASLDKAKEFLANVKKDGMNGLISKGGKPVKEESEIDEKWSKSDQKKFKPKTPKHANRATAGVEKKEREDAKRKELGLEEVEINEADYQLYHKDFSSAMQHAYAHAKKRGYEVSTDEIDSKVATGPKKPSSGKTNKYILGTNKRQKVHIQVANLDNKKYELNMYIEETEKKVEKTVKKIANALVPTEEKEEDHDDPKGYEKKVRMANKKFGIKSPNELEGKKKKSYFDFLDSIHKAKGEKPEANEVLGGIIPAVASYAVGKLAGYAADKVIGSVTKKKEPVKKEPPTPATTSNEVLDAVGAAGLAYQAGKFLGRTIRSKGKEDSQNKKSDTKPVNKTKPEKPGIVKKLDKILPSPDHKDSGKVVKGGQKLPPQKQSSKATMKQSYVPPTGNFLEDTRSFLQSLWEKQAGDEEIDGPPPVPSAKTMTKKTKEDIKINPKEEG